MKRMTAALLALFLLCLTPAYAAGAEAEAQSSAALTITAPSGILMEKTTGTILYEKDAHTQYEPASVTKVMTLLLVMEAIDAGQLAWEDMVTASAHAISMGGSQIWLKENEQLSVRDMVKAVAVVSANDCAVALAEHVAGSEEAFVALMNQRASELGMEHTHFLNCTGLPASGHVTCAYDIALMSRALILNHPEIREFTTIWMDTLRDGDFQLANTNKLVRYYEGATGLKTGSTDAALYCLSATAEKEGMELIAVILGAPTSNDRFEGAKALLNYGFAAYALVPVAPSEPLTPVPVTLGTAASVQPGLAQERQLLLPKGEAGKVTTTVDLPSALSAPVEAGQELGHLTVLVDGQAVEEIPLVAQEAVGKRSLWQVYGGLLAALFCGAGEAGF